MKGPTPKKAWSAASRRRLKRAAIGAGALLLVGGAGIATWKLLVSRGPIVSVAFGKLPETVDTLEAYDPALRWGQLQLRADDIPDEARWSDVAKETCGGRDLFRELMDPASAGGVEALAAEVADKDEAAATLACGKAVAASIGKKARLVTVRFRVKREAQYVVLTPLADKDLPTLSKHLKSLRDPDHFENTRCRRADGEPAPAPTSPRPLRAHRDSDDKHEEPPCAWAVGKIEHDNLWVSGPGDTLRAFGDAWSPEAKNKIDDAELFERVANAMRGDVVSAGHGDDGLALEQVGNVTDEEIHDRMRKGLRDVVVWGSSVSLDGPFQRVHVELHTAKEDDAKDLESTVERYVRELKREAKDADEDGVDVATKDSTDLADDAPPEQKKLRAALRTLRWHAYEDATIETKGEVVTVDVVDKPADADKALWKAYADLNRERAKKAARIIDALAAGQPPSEEDEKGIAPELATLLHPPESIALEGFADLRIPGGGKCFVIDETTQTCAFAKWDKPTAVDKIKTQVTKAGFAFIPDKASDATFVAKKESAVVTMSVFASTAGGAHVTLHTSPLPPKAP